MCCSSKNPEQYKQAEEVLCSMTGGVGCFLEEVEHNVLDVSDYNPVYQKLRSRWPAPPGSDPAHSSWANRPPGKVFVYVWRKRRGSGVPTLNRHVRSVCACVCSPHVWVFGQAQWIQFLEAPPSCREFLRTLTITNSWKRLTNDRDRTPCLAAPEEVWNRQEGVETGLVYVNLAVPQNATAPSPLPLSGFIDTRGSKQASVFAAPNSLNLCVL